MISQKNLRVFVYLLIIFFSINYIFFTYRFFVRENGFILGDWLINYAGGFVRRGLVGEIIINLVNLFKLDIIFVSFVVVSTLFSFFLYYLIKLIKSSNISFFILIIIFSPATLLFNLFDPLAVGRKEIIFFLYLLIYLEFRDHIYSRILLIPGSLICMLTHELFILLCPFFFISRYFANNQIKLKNFSIEFLIIFLSVIYLFIIIFFSNPDISKMCLKLLEEGLGQNGKICLAISSTQKSSFVLGSYIKDIFYIKYYFIFFVLISLPIYIVLTENLSKNYLISCVFIVLTILPFFSLFLIVNDWGRYLNIFSMYWMIILLHNSKKIINEIKIKKIYLFLVFLFSSTWYMPHCCPELHFKDKIYNSSTNYLIERINYRFNYFK